MDSEINLKKVSEQDNYSKWLFEKIQPFLGKEILEVGAGLGVFTKLLEEDNRKVMPIDKQSYDNYYCKTKIKIFDITENPKKIDSSFDTIVCMNVLEHIKDDNKALKNMYEYLDNKGSLILIIPAFQFAYGPVDKSNNHYRRYSKKDIISKMKNAGYKIKNLEYMNLVGLLGWLYQNKILRSGIHRSTDLKRFNRLCPLFNKVESIMTTPFGLNLFLVAEK